MIPVMFAGIMTDAVFAFIALDALVNPGQCLEASGQVFRIDAAVKGFAGAGRPGGGNPEAGMGTVELIDLIANQVPVIGDIARRLERRA